MAALTSPLLRRHPRALALGAGAMLMAFGALGAMVFSHHQGARPLGSEVSLPAPTQINPDVIDAFATLDRARGFAKQAPLSLAQAQRSGLLRQPPKALKALDVRAIEFGPISVIAHGISPQQCQAYALSPPKPAYRAQPGFECIQLPGESHELHYRQDSLPEAQRGYVHIELEHQQADQGSSERFALQVSPQRQDECPGQSLRGMQSIDLQQPGTYCIPVFAGEAERFSKIEGVFYPGEAPEEWEIPSAGTLRTLQMTAHKGSNG